MMDDTRNELWPDDYMPDDDDDIDPIEYAMGECGKGSIDGLCGHAGSEYCDFECPFNN